jgi:HPt (histidine-containing phosphotransfer) domain-containing protein
MSFEDLIKSLQNDYLASLPEKTDRIQGQIERTATEELRESFHKLKGTGRTYGLPEVSELAAAVESLCLTTPADATRAAAQAVLILKDIHAARLHGLDFNLHQDPRFHAIQQLLPQ